MIHIEKHNQTIILTRDGQAFRMPASEAPRLIAELLRELGVSGTPMQQGYQIGRTDGERLGYQQRDREYVTAAAKARRAAERATLAALPATEARAA